MIYVFLANGFEEIEALAPVDILRRAELEVKTVGVGGKTITGSHGITVTADIEEKDVTTDDMELMILPGGMPGTLNLEKSPSEPRKIADRHNLRGILRKERHLPCGNLRCTERSRPSRPPER